MSDEIEGTVDEIGTAVEIHEQAAPLNLFRTDDPVEVLEKAARCADALKGVIDQKRLYKRIGNKDHVLVEGWATCGAMLGLTAATVWSRPLGEVVSEKGHDWEARVEVRTLDGRVIGAAEAMCTRKEQTWKSRDDYALRSMAQTRATSKALRGPLGFIVTLAGYSATPAEEMPSDASQGGFSNQQTPVERDVKTTGKSDVPAEDPWFAEVKPSLKGIPSAGLKAAVVSAGGEVPEHVSSWARVISALDPGQREKFIAAVGQLSEMPWTEPENSTEIPGQITIDEATT